MLAFLVRSILAKCHIFLALCPTSLSFVNYHAIKRCLRVKACIKKTLLNSVLFPVTKLRLKCLFVIFFHRRALEASRKAQVPLMVHHAISTIPVEKTGKILFVVIHTSNLSTSIIEQPIYC